MDKRKKYNSGDAIEWIAEINCIKVYNNITHNLMIIPYPKAAIWDLVQHKYSINQITRIISAITKKEASYAEELTARTIRAWLRGGLIK
jgi:hypothetical protein